MQRNHSRVSAWPNPSSRRCGAVDPQSLLDPDPRPARRTRGATCWPSPTGSGKTLAFAVPIVQRLDAADTKPSALVLVPTRELAVQVAEEFADIGRTRGLQVAAAHGGTSVGAQAKAARALTSSSPRWTPGGSGEAPAHQPRRDPDPRPRRGRPHARHGLPAAGRRDRSTAAPQAADDVLLRHARRRSRRACAFVHAEPEPHRRRAAGAARGGGRPSIGSSASPPRARSTCS